MEAKSFSVMKDLVILLFYIQTSPTSMDLQMFLVVEYDVSSPTNLSKYLIHKRRVLYHDSNLIQGPLYLNETTSLISVTVAITNNASRSDVLGWLTVVIDARPLYEIVASPEGLESTGEVLIVGPFINDNLFYQKVRGSSAEQNSDVIMTFILPPYSNDLGRSSCTSRFYHWKSGSAFHNGPIPGGA
jgi:hypothetical protein